MDISSVLEQVERDNVKYIQLQFSDIHGITKSITVPAKSLKDIAKDGKWFDGSSIDGFTRIFESDMFLKPDPSTYSIMPWLESEDGNTARLICDVYKPDGQPFEGDPRYILKKVMQEAKEMGFQYNTGPELEFFIFKKDNGSIKPLPHDVGGYFDINTDLAYKIRRDMAVALKTFGIDVESLHHEVAPGQHEISFKYGDALKTADNAMTFRYVLKAIALDHDLHVTFMPKPIGGMNGSGMHVHQSLSDVHTGRNMFFDENDKYNFSRTAYNFIAGQLSHVKAMSAVIAPTVNSYKRLVPGYEAPVYVCWATTNRSALIRVPRSAPGKSESTRIELRCPDPSSNVYLAFAVMLKAGLDGIKKDLTPPNPLEQNVYDFDDNQLHEHNVTTLPHSLWQALKELKADRVIQDALGEHTFNKYVEAKTREWDDFRLQVTQWELDRYLEKY